MASGSFARRLAITIVLPTLVVLVGRNVLVPGAHDFGGRDQSALGIFALGTDPILTAFWLVELVAFFVGPLKRLRNGSPEGRAKLDRAVGVLALLLASVQAYAGARSLESIESTFRDSTASEISIPLVTLTLLGGVCVQFVIARAITKRGLLNGFVALSGASFSAGLLGALGNAGHSGRSFLALASSPSESPAKAALGILGLAAVGGATWLVLGSPSAPASELPPARDAHDGSAPYRATSTRRFGSWIPLPASSLQPLGTSASLLTLVGTFVLGEQVVGVFGDRLFVPARIALTLALAACFTIAMHRPAEMAVFAVRLGAGGREGLAKELAIARRKSALPTALYLLVLLLASGVTKLGLFAPVLVAIGIDLVQASRLAMRDLVPVWEERRASAVPALRSVLVENGIASEVRGLAYLSLWQVFAPYAPAEILVRRDDAERATATLRHWTLGEGNPAKAPRESATPILPAARPWTPTRRNAALGALAFAAVVVFGLCNLPHRLPSHGRTSPRATIAIIRVDDTRDPFADVTPPADIELQSESVGGRSRVIHAQRRVQDGETEAAARLRFQTWLATIPLHEGERFGIGRASAIVDEPGSLRSYLLVGDAVIDEHDVEDAQALPPSDDVQAVMAIALSRDGGERFAAATGEWRDRRLAILVDGEVNSAPIVRSEIRGGRLSITFGRDEADGGLRRAKELADRLRP